MPNDWKISAFFWSVLNALQRSPMQEDNQRMEMGVYFFIFLPVQLDNALRGRSPPCWWYQGDAWLGWTRGGRSTDPWSPKSTALDEAKSFRCPRPNTAVISLLFFSLSTVLLPCNSHIPRGCNFQNVSLVPNSRFVCSGVFRA